jgi:hypothetical protein
MFAAAGALESAVAPARRRHRHLPAQVLSNACTDKDIVSPDVCRLLQALLTAQQLLLEDITGSWLQLSSTSAGAEELASTLSSLKGKVPLLLLLDNVPEAGGGLTKMLPDLQATLPEG